MKIEFGKKAQIIIALLLLIGAAGAIAEYGNNINIPGNFTGLNGIFSGDISANDITVSGTVDGVDIASSINQGVRTTDSPTFNNIIVSGNVDGVDISASINQGVRTTDSPTFSGINATDINADKIGGVIYAAQYATIQDALNALPASGGTVISTVSETTANPIVINSNTTLICQGGVITGSGSFVITNKNNATRDVNIIIEGCNIRSGNTPTFGISLYNTTGSVIRNNILIHNGVQNVAGIATYYSSENSIYNNNMTGWGIGILYASHDTEVYGNSIYDVLPQDTDGHGIVVSGGAGDGYRNYIHHNWIFGVSGLGISIDGGSYENIVESNFINDTSSDSLNFESGYGFSPKNNKMLNNIIKNAGRVAVTGVSPTNTAIGNTISGNTVISPISDAYYFLYVNGSTMVSNFAYDGAATAYLISASSNNTISGNYATNFSDRGFIEFNDLGSSLKNVVRNNYFINTTGIAATNSITIDNYGFAPFDHGKFSASPPAFGAGDKYYDTDVNYYCYYNSTAWVDMSTGLVTCS